MPQSAFWKFQSTPSAWRETFLSSGMLSHHSNFNPLPPHGGRPPAETPEFRLLIFQSTPSAWRETSFPPILDCAISISIHSLRMEGDIVRSALLVIGFEFQSTPSAWRETEKYCAVYQAATGFQSTPSAWRETKRNRPTHRDGTISIHSLRMEGDFVRRKLFIKLLISIHSLRMEGD